MGSQEEVVSASVPSHIDLASTMGAISDRRAARRYKHRDKGGA
jgi:hypothetical protein